MLDKVRLGMTLQAFVERYEQEPFELIDGEVIPMPPVLYGHSHMAHVLYNALLLFALKTQLGEPHMETPFVLPDATEPNWVEGSRVPDVMFIRAERLAEYKQNTPDWSEKPLAIVPDLVVEAVSKNDTYTKVNEKAASYLHDGVKLVWLMDPRRHTVTVFRSGSKQQVTLNEDDILAGEEVIPGFQIAIKELFQG
jgi:Uma2 family endonuclease